MSGELKQVLNLHLLQNDLALDFSSDAVDTLHNFILNRLPKSDNALAEAARHHFAKPGKMLRAKMALRAAKILKIDTAAALHWAVAIEVLHNASLIHDDICDGDQLRRGRLSVWSKYGRNVALTLGDWLIALAFELAAEAGQRANTPSLVKILAQHMATTTAGEAAEFSLHTGLDWERYLEIAADKTAPLLTAPLEGVAAMALHGNAGAAIGTYFRNLGTAYQIANDILNFRALDGAADLGSDLARRAPNAVVVQYRQSLCAERLSAFDEWCVSGSVEHLKSLQDNILHSDALALSAHEMHNALEKTALCAQALPVGLIEAISPVQALLTQVCIRSVAPVSC
jgi:geranylgeranyl pyrophosphate synthase